MLMQKIHGLGLKIFPYVRNKFIFTSFLFFIWMTFFDQSNFIDQIQDRMKLSELEEHRDQLAAEISQSNEDLMLLQTDEKLLEKFARERYLMKKVNEDIFVFAIEEE